MIRKSLNLTRLAVPGTSYSLVLATGTSKNILEHIETIDDKRALMSAGTKKSASRAMVLYVDGFEGSVEKAKTSIPATLVQSILGSSSFKGWNFFNAFNYLGDKIDVVVGSPLLATAKKVQKFAMDFATKIFADGGLIDGAIEDTRALLLIGPDAERFVMAFNYETYELAILPQPFGSEITRYTFVGDTVVALQFGTGNVTPITRKAIIDAIGGLVISWQANVELNGKIDDLMLGIDVGDGNYAIVASGQYDGKPSQQVLSVLSLDDERQITATADPTALDTETASWGSLVRFDRTNDVSIYVNHNGGTDTVTRVPTHLLSAPAKSVVQSLVSN